MFNLFSSNVKLKEFTKFAQTTMDNIKAVEQLVTQSIDSVVDTKIVHLVQQLNDITKTYELKFEEIEKALNQIKLATQEVITRTELKNSDEPWIELLGSSVDPEKGLKLHLDWNDAFIQQLKAQGYTGTSESALIAQYLKLLGDNLNQDGFKQ